MKRMIAGQGQLALLATLMIGLLAVAPDGLAQVGQVTIKNPFRGTRPMTLDLHGGFTHLGNGPAVGARFSIPIVQNGFVPSINNAVFITFGGDFYWLKIDHNDYEPAVGFPVTLHWQFYFTTRWSAFGEAGFNLFLHPSLFRGDGWVWAGGHWAIAAVGGRYQLSKSIALVLRLGNPYSCFGATFKF